MKITFKSTIVNDQGTNEIDFTSPVEITQMDEYKVYEFVEPQNNVMNRIEVSENRVNIFAGPSTVILVKDQLIQNEYYTEAGTIFFDSEVQALDITDNYIMFKYTLGQINNPFGRFKIELMINE